MVYDKAAPLEQVYATANKFLENYTGLELAVMLMGYMSYEDVLRELHSFEDIEVVNNGVVAKDDDNGGSD